MNFHKPQEINIILYRNATDSQIRYMIINKIYTDLKQPTVVFLVLISLNNWIKICESVATNILKHLIFYYTIGNAFTAIFSF